MNIYADATDEGIRESMKALDGVIFKKSVMGDDGGVKVLFLMHLIIDRFS